MARIVHVTSVHWAFDIRVFQKECRSLAAAGHQVTLIAPHEREEDRDGVRILPVRPGRNRWHRMASTAREAVSRAAAEPADIYHLHDPELLLWVGKLRSKGVPVVYDMHEDLPRQVRTKAWLPAIIRWPLSAAVVAFERASLARQPVVLAEKSYGTSRPWLTDSASVLNFPRLEWLADLPAVDSPVAESTVGYLGTVTETRGCLVTVEAVASLQRAGHSVGFLCIGPIDDGLRARVESMAAAAGVGESVHITGRMTAQSAWREMTKCSVGLALLAPLPNYIESFPTKMFEYMALGLPVIVSDFPLYSEIVEQCGCGLVVDPLDPEAIAAAILELLESPDRMAEMGRRGKDAAQAHYSWASEERKLLAFYDGLLGR